MTIDLNIGRPDQIARAIIGAGLIVAAGLGAFDGVWKVLAVALGSIAVFTASAGYCPLYRLLHLNSCRSRI